MDALVSALRQDAAFLADDAHGCASIGVAAGRRVLSRYSLT